MPRTINRILTTEQPVFFESPKDVFRRIRNYLAGQFVGATRDDVLLEEVLKCLFCKLLVERGEIEPINTSADSFELARQVREAFARVRSEFSEIYPENTEFLLDPKSLQYVMTQLNFSIMDSSSDPIGDAYEVFVGSESRGNSGQFFTPRSVSSLLVDALDPRPGETILDPACGAGGFLASACASLEKHGISTNALSNALFGIDKDIYLTQLAKVHIALLTGAHPTIIHGDSITLQNGDRNIREYLPPEGVDVVLTNPPFGVRIVSGSPEVFRRFDLAKRWTHSPHSGKYEPTEKIQNNVPPQVLFVERCIDFLKPGGRLGMVLPESILSNKSYRHVVEFLLRNTKIRGVIGMPEALFKTSGKGGTHTKTCLLIATKHSEHTNKKPVSIFMAEAKWCGQDSRARLIPHNDLPVITQNFREFKTRKLKTSSTLGFALAEDEIVNGVLCPRYYDPQGDQDLAQLHSTHYLLKFSDLVAEGVLQVTTGDEVGKLAYGTGPIPFIRTSDISNWELKAEPKHGVSAEIYQGLRKKQDVKAGDILMVKDGTYLIGTCAIITSADPEIVFQSHLYKIRINPNRYGLDPFILLAVLSSTAVQRQIRSKQFTQDIIDSLGERINELVLPIPKSDVDRTKVSKLVRDAVKKRIEARNLAKKARSLVTNQIEEGTTS
jgi:type I restriction enzyme M protein